MATITASLSSTNLITSSIMADTVWAETSLQYYFGGADALTLDTEFEEGFHGDFRGLPDATFRFAADAQRAYDAISAVSLLTFQQTTDTAVADLVLVSSAKDFSGDLEGFFNFPGTSFRDDETQLDSWQIGAFNSGMKSLAAEGEFGGGKYLNWTLFHEVGHSMGLLHTHSESKGTPPLPEIGPLDNERYSVMSYNPASFSNKFGHAVTYMALDVAALQAQYGVNGAYAAGDSTYTLTGRRGGELSLAEGAMSIGQAYACIWDTGGKDTIEYAGAGGVVLNLNAATLDKTVDLGLDVLRETAVVGLLTKAQRADLFSDWHTAGGSFSFARDTVGGYSIANGVTIENATGGNGRDLLIGNDGDNILIGGAARDTLFGNGGADILTGGLGGDIFIYSEGATISDFNANEGDILVGDWPVG